MAEQKAKQKQEVAVFPITPDRRQEMQHANRIHNVRVPSNVTREMLTDHRLWANVASKLEIYDEIRVIPDEGEYRALLLVEFSDRHNVRLRELDYQELEGMVDIPQNDEYEIAQRGSKNFVIKRREDGNVIKEGITSRAQAYKELDEYIQALER